MDHVILPLPWLLPLVCGVGLVSLWWWTRRLTKDRWLVRGMLASYAARAVLAMGLYAISYWHWPILSNLHAPEGFWTLGPDSYEYHLFGMDIAKAWHLGTSLPRPHFEFEYIAFVGAVYALLGVHPLLPILVNVWLASATALLAYQVGRRLGDHRSGLVSAWLVLLWPSGVVWSVLLLKDALCTFLVFAALGLVLQAMPVRPAMTTTRWWPVHLVVTAVVLLVLTRYRFYLGFAIACSVLVVCGVAAVRAALHKQRGTALRAVVVTTLLIVTSLYARTLDTFQLLSPRRPEQGHLRQATRLWEQGDLREAARHHVKALPLIQYDPHRYLSPVLGEPPGVAFDAFEAALQVYQEPLTALRNVGPKSRDTSKIEAFEAALAHVLRHAGAAALREGRYAEAIQAFSRAFAEDSEFAKQRAQLALAHLRLATEQWQAGELAASAAHHLQAIWLQEKGLQGEWLHIVQLPTPNTRFEEALLVYADFAQRMDGLLTTAQQASLDGLRARVHVRVARAHVERRHFTAAATAARYALTLDPQVPLARSYLDVTTRDPHQRNLELLQHAVTKVTAEAQSQPFAQAAVPVTTAVAASSAPLNATGEQGPHRPMMSRAAEQLRRILATLTPEFLGVYRRGFVRDQGHATIDPLVQFSTLGGMLAYLPRALAIGFLAPFPWQWFDTKGSTGAMRLFAGCETFLVYLLMPWIGIAVVRALRQRRLDSLCILLFVLLTAAAISLVVANLGILFRLRLQFLLPLLVVAAAQRPWSRTIAGTPS